MGAPAGCSGPMEKTRHPPLGAALGVQLGARALTVLLPRGNCASNGPIALITPVLSLVFLPAPSPFPCHVAAILVA